jgi:hypothetical protein
LIQHFPAWAGRHAAHRVKKAVVAVTVLAASAAAQAPVDLRVALVIGNSAYAGNAALANPANDAAAMSAALRKLGFQVTELRDGSRTQMANAVAAVRQQLQGKRGVGMLYYAGHGLQIDWRNYMLPVDARPVSQADIVAQAVDVDAVIEAFKQSGTRMNILVLDACRDNPFAGTAAAKGLAQMDAPPGTFLAYATAPGNTADDGANGNGLYTGFLLNELVRPTARIEDVFKRVRLQVRQKSQGRQIPWESTSLEEDFVFNDGRPAGAPPAPAAPPTERQVLAEREQAFERDKAQWDRIKNSRNPDDFYAFLQASPSGPIAEAAQDRLDQLAKPAVVPTPVQGRAPIQRDPRVGDELEYVYRDFLTKLETRRETQRVTSIKDGLIEFNGGEQVITMSGGTVRNDSGVTFDPPLQVLPVGQFQIGHRWVTRTVQTLPSSLGVAPMGMPSVSRQGWLEQEMKVVAYEEIQIPAGTFKTYRLQAVLRSHTGLYGNVDYWVSETGAVLRYVRRARLANGRDNSWIREVVRVHRPR